MRKHSLALGLALVLVATVALTVHYRQQCLKLGRDLEHTRLAASSRRATSAVLPAAVAKTAATTPAGEADTATTQVKLQVEVQRLDAQVAELEADVQAQRNINAELQARLARQAPRDGNRGPDRMGGSEPPSPEVAAEWVARATAARARFAEARTQRLDFFQQIDTAQLTEAEKQTHQSLIAALQSAQEIEQQMAAATSAEDRAALQQAWREKNAELANLMAAERPALLQEMGRTLGVTGDKLKPLEEYLTVLAEMTDARRGRGWNRGGPPPGGGTAPASATP